MKQIKLVIGANYGDEGKGLVSRYFGIRTKNPVVILYNGSAQRGHTADYMDGSRHVYHHLGTSFLDGVPTYFAETFMLHPMEFRKELDTLNGSKIIWSFAYYNPLCDVVTPLDVAVDLIERDVKKARTGKDEFGSCCMGTYSLKRRLAREEWHTKLSDYKRDTYKPLKRIYDEYFWQELASRGITKEDLPDQWQFMLEDDIVEKITKSFRKDIEVLSFYCAPAYMKDIYDKFDTLIFEGAQGLLLDNSRKVMEDGYVTSTFTGSTLPARLLRNVIRLEDEVEVCYVTRTYITRHGEGYLDGAITDPEELKKYPIDETNMPNDCQGTIRYAEMGDYRNTMVCEIVCDMAKWLDMFNGNITMSIAITHVGVKKFDPPFRNDPFGWLWNKYRIYSFPYKQAEKGQLLYEVEDLTNDE